MVAFHKGLFGFAAANENKFVRRLNGLFGVGAGGHAFRAPNAHNIALGLFANVAVLQGEPHQGGGSLHPEDAEPFGQQKDLARGEQVDHGIGGHGGVGHDQACPGAVERGHVAVETGPADYLNIRPEFAAVNGQIDVQIVVMGSDDNRFGGVDAGLEQGFKIRGIPQNVAGVILGDVPGVAFYNPEGDKSEAKRS